MLNFMGMVVVHNWKLTVRIYGLDEVEEEKGHGKMESKTKARKSHSRA